MTDYKAIVGKGIKVVSTNLDNAEAEGQIWFNSTTGEFKDVVNIEAWSSASPLSTPRFNMGSGNTPVTAGLIFGGSGKSTATENYDGTNWSTGGALGTGRYQLSGFGTQTAGLGAGGYASPSPGDKALVEEYNGTSWSEVNDLPAARRGAAGFGTQTAGAIAGGVPNLNTTLHYDGTNWTSGGNLPVGQDRTEGAGTGTLTAGFMAAGDNRTSFEYDGSSWTAGPSTSSDHDGGSDTGIQTAAITFGGFLSPGSGQVTSTELYNGTSFTTSPATMANGRYGAGNGGFTGTSAFAAGGDKNPGTITDTEEYNSSTTVITSSAFAAGGNMPSGKRVGGSSTGGSIVALTFGGDNLPMAQGQPQIKSTEEYDGASWTAGGNVGNNVSRCAGSGTQTAGLGAGGYSTGTPWQTPNAAYIANAFEYDGSSWTNVTAMPITMDGHTAFGTQTAAVYGAGSQGPNPSPGPAATYRSKNTFHYDGTNWTSGGAMNDFHSDTDATAGTQTAGIIFGGYAGSPLPGSTTSLEEYNGSSWTTALSGLRAISIGGGFGTQSLFLSAGGQNAPIPNSPGTTGYSLNSQLYDGTTFGTDASIATRRVIVGCDGVVGTAAGMICGGSTSYSSRTTATEEYTQGSTALNIKTVSTS